MTAVVGLGASWFQVETAAADERGDGDGQQAVERCAVGQDEERRRRPARRRRG